MPANIIWSKRIIILSILILYITVFLIEAFPEREDLEAYFIRTIKEAGGNIC